MQLKQINHLIYPRRLQNEEKASLCKTQSSMWENCRKFIHSFHFKSCFRRLERLNLSLLSTFTLLFTRAIVIFVVDLPQQGDSKIAPSHSPYAS